MINLDNWWESRVGQEKQERIVQQYERANMVPAYYGCSTSTSTIAPWSASAGACDKLAVIMDMNLPAMDIRHCWAKLGIIVPVYKMRRGDL